MRLRTHRDVFLFAVLITAVAVTVTATFIHFVTHAYFGTPVYAIAMLLGVGLPFVIALPISLIALYIARYISLSVYKIEEFVKFDALTGALARNYFLERVRTQFDDGGALMLVDADHFKRINDTLGHNVGDDALRTLGGTINAEVPAHTHVGRIGGEEFGIFMPGATPEEAEQLAETLCDAVRESGKVIDGRKIGLTVSIGVAMIKPGATVSLTLKAADESLYFAKNAGRDRYIFADMHERAPVIFEPLAAAGGR